jgi:glucosylceramidase
MSQPTSRFDQASVYLTARNTADRLARKDDVDFEPFEQPFENEPTMILDRTRTFQTIAGFGGAFTDAAAETLFKLSPERQQEILTAYFDPEQGIGYTLCRTHINSCDFSSSSYAYTEVPGDTALQHFTIDHDRQYRIPFIRKALETSAGQLQLFASPWSPPAWMKTNGEMLHGGRLKPEYRAAWAQYFVRFVQAYEQEGVPIWGLTVQNEPMAVQTWESCIYTAAEERDFVRDYLGPALHAAGLERLKLMIWDHNRGIMYQRAKTVLDDPEAAQYVWGTAYHWYDGDHFDAVQLVHDAYPDKHLLYSEAALGPFDLDRVGEWQWGEHYARSVILDLNHWCEGWVDWNLVLDEQGGPNHVGNYCYAPIVSDTRTDEVHYMNAYYYLGHISRFVRPGARRIVCSSNCDDLLATAFENVDAKIAVIALNASDQDLDARVWIDGQAAPVHAPAHSMMTVII